VTDDKYFTYSYDDGYPVINLNETTGNDLTGKITLPAKDPNGEDILGIGLFASYYNPGMNYAGAVPPQGNVTGANITHIFFEKGSNYKYVEKCAFYNPSGVNDNYKLKAVCLPDTIVEIRDRAF
jgi:hypothetical protein